MDDLLAARWTMAISLGFHIILAAIGMVMPWLMVLAHARWLKTRTDAAYILTRAWGRGVAIFFAVGAVSGTALSFELGLLWPEFMTHAGPIIGMPFSLEGAAFFVEAIALGIYLYGWGKLSPWLHWASGGLVGIAGVLSGVLVVAANGWMNSPAGFDWVDGQAINISPWAAMMNDAWFAQASHMVIAAFQAVGFAVAGVHALLLLRGSGSSRAVNQEALRISLGLGAIAAVIQPLNGHYAAQDVAERQPAKLAAMEAHFETSTYAPLVIGGLPSEAEREVYWGLKIPGGLSLLAFDNPAAEVKGLDQFPEEEWPPVLVVHLAFQVMVGIGSAMALVGVFSLWGIWRHRSWLYETRFLQLLGLMTPLGFVAMEAGWVVTEVGRQPWIIYGILKTQDAVTPVPGQVFHLLLFIGLYGLLGFCTAWMWMRQVSHSQKLELASVPKSLTSWAFEKEA